MKQESDSSVTLRPMPPPRREDVKPGRGRMAMIACSFAH